MTYKNNVSECLPFPGKVCEVGEFLTNNDCARCDSQCQKCIHDASNCVDCKPDQFISKNPYAPSFHNCIKYCNEDESRIKGKRYYKCATRTDSNRKCEVGSYKDERGFCKLCHPTCESCDGPNQVDCTGCLNDEYQISGKKNGVQSFECSQSCDKSTHSAIPGKKYSFCGVDDEVQWHRGDREAQGQSNGSQFFDWIHIICFVIISNLLVGAAIFLYFKLRKKKQSFTIYSTQKDLLQAETEHVEEIEIVTKDQIDMGEKKKLLGRGAFGIVYKVSNFTCIPELLIKL